MHFSGLRFLESNMAKFAVVFLAALAFQVASAGVRNRLPYQEEKSSGKSEYGLQYYGYPTGKFDALFGQLQTVSQDLNVYLQKVVPDDRLVIKTLVWQSRELVQYIDNIIERLQVEAQQYSGKINVFESFVNELREIRVQYQKIADYSTNVYAVDQLKSQFYTVVQRTVTQLEKLVRYVQTNYDQSKGDIYVVVKNVVSDFLYAFENIYSHVQYYGAYGEQSPKQLVFQIEQVTKNLIGYLQGVTYVDARRSYAIREYVQYIEAIINRLEKVEGTYGNAEVDVIFQQVYGKLRRVVVPFSQFVESQYDNVEVVRTQLINELQCVAEVFEQFVLYTQAGDYQSFFFEILGDYLYAIQQFRIQLQSGYQGYYGAYQGQYYGNSGQGYYGKYGRSEYQGGAYDKSGYRGAAFDKFGSRAAVYDKSGYQGGAYDKSGYRSGAYDKSGYRSSVYDKSGNQVGLYGKSAYQYGSVYDKVGYQGSYNDKTAYQGLYKYGGLYDKTGYSYFGKYQGYANYDLKQYGIQIQAIIRDLYKTFETVSFDDVIVRQTFVQVIRQYTQQLEYIVERLHQIVNYNAENNVYIYQQIAENLRQYLLGLEQCYSREYSGAEFGRQIYLYVEKISAEFEKLLSGIEQTNGAYNAYVREILIQYLRVTYDLYSHFQNYSEIAQYGYGPYARQYYGDNYYGGKYYGNNYYGGNYYGNNYYGQSYETPREVANQIQYVCKDLYAIFQSAGFYNQQHAQIIAVQARQFVQTIAYVVDRLERYENVNPIIQQAIYRLHEVQESLQQLITYNVFTNVNQLSVEFYKYIQAAAADIERLVFIGQEESQGEYYYAIKDVFQYFLYGLRDIQYQIQQVAQYGDYIHYGQGYGYGKYGQGYSYGNYGQGYGQEYGYGKYGQGYGYGKYGQQNAYNKYEQGYGYGYGKNDQSYGKYGQEYGYGKYEQSNGKYGQDYAYGKYNQGADKYGQKYGYGKYGQGSGKYGKYDQSYGKYGQEYGYGKYDQSNGKYGQDYGYGKYNQVAEKYGQEYSGKYSQGSGKYGKYDQSYGKYGQEYGYGKYDQSNGKYGQDYGYGKYNQVAEKYGQKYSGKYSQGSGKYGKYDQSYGKYGQEYGYGKYDQSNGKYGQDYGYGKYNEDAKKYGQKYSTGKYDQGSSKYSKYDQSYGKYGQEYGNVKYDQSNGKYGQDYGYGKYNQGVDKYGQGYGKYGQQYGNVKYDQAYSYGKYGNDKYGQSYGYGKGYDKYSRGVSSYGSIEQLVNQIQSIASEVATELQSVNINDQFVFAQARQFIQLIDNTLNQFQVEYANDAQQVIVNLRQIRVQLERIISSGNISTAQIANYFQEFTVALKQLALVAQNDEQYNQIVKGVLGEYIVYLRNVQYQIQYNGFGYEGYQSGFGYQRVPYYGAYLGYGQYYQDASRGY